MSLARPRPGFGPKNPAVKFIKWKGSAVPEKGGYYAYYDGQKDVKVDMSKGFHIIDADLFSVKGWNDRTKTNYISNEVYTVDDTLVINAYKDKVKTHYKTGPYSELKEIVKDSAFLKYCRSVYINLNGELCHLELTGKAIVSFGNVTKGFEATHIILPTGHTIEKAGTNEYLSPTFSRGEKVSAEMLAESTKMDLETLGPYLEQYLKNGGNGAKSSAGGDYTPSEAELHGDDEKPPYDTKQWRAFSDKKGVCLADYNRTELLELHDQLLSEGDTESDLFNCVGHAKYDYQNIEKTIGDKKSKDGRKLIDWTLDEVRPVYKTVSEGDPLNAGRQVLEILLEIKEAEAAKNKPVVDDSGAPNELDENEMAF